MIDHDDPIMGGWMQLDDPAEARQIMAGLTKAGAVCVAYQVVIVNPTDGSVHTFDIDIDHARMRSSAPRLTHAGEHTT
jgi:hypothetical protein